MSLPEHRVPPEETSPLPAGVPPAEVVERAPVWDRTGTRWTWVADQGAYVCDDPEYPGEPVVEPGAIPEERQPFFAAPPNEAQVVGMRMHEDER